MSFFAELKRRNVFKVGIAYAIVAWLLIQVVSIVLPAYHAPDWVLPILITIISIGFPIAVFLAWAYELTPEGIKPTKPITKNSGKASTSDTEPSIAVLPFADMSPDKDQEYFADGIAEEVLNQLARINDLHVAGRTSSFSFKGKEEDLRVIGSKLNVAHVLEGSVRKSGDQLRITAQLIKVADGYHLWSETYDRTLEDIFTIQDEIARSVARALQITLGVGALGHSPGMTRNVAAYDTYLSGRFLANQLGRENFSRAIEQLEQALALDPDFALAWVNLARVYNYAARVYMPEKAWDYTAKEETALSRAIAIAPDSVPSLNAAAGLHRQRREWVAAEQSYQKALTLAPADYDANFGYAGFLLLVGRSTEAVDYYMRAVRLEPLVAIVHFLLGVAYHICGNHTAAEEAGNRSKQLTDRHEVANILLLTLAMEGNNQARIKEYAELVGNSELHSDLNRPGKRHVHKIMPALLDKPEAAGIELRQFLDDPAYNNPLYRLPIADWASYYGEYQLALQALLEVSDSSSFIEYAIWRPLHKPMRRLPGFKDLVTKLGLVDYWRSTGKWGEFCRPVGEDDFECE